MSDKNTTKEDSLMEKAEQLVVHVSTNALGEWTKKPVGLWFTVMKKILVSNEETSSSDEENEK